MARASPALHPQDAEEAHIRLAICKEASVGEDLGEAPLEAVDKRSRVHREGQEACLEQPSPAAGTQQVWLLFPQVP